jgi:CheY-like chemotaxis protein
VQDSARAAAMAAGAVAYLTKPYDPAEVIAVVTRAIEAHRRSA